MYKLLLPVDGSASSAHAVKHVIELTGVAGPVHMAVLNVQPSVDAWEVKRFLSKQEIQAIQTAASAEATRAARSLLEQAGIDFEVHYTEGDVAETIAEFANAGGFNQIVMGTRGMSSLKGLLLGSISTKVLHLAEVPVTLVK